MMPLSSQFDEQDPKVVSEDAAIDLVLLINQMIDDKFNKRLAQNDVPQCFDARITATNNTTQTIAKITIPGTSGSTEYPVEAETTVSVSAEYDDYVYNNVMNCTGRLLSVGQWVKVYTYDNVKYYALHIV